MIKRVVIPITCPCKEQKKFRFTAQLANTPASTEGISVQIDCPFGHEESCVKHLTIKLPPGTQLKDDESILRG